MRFSKKVTVLLLLIVVLVFATVFGVATAPSRRPPPGSGISLLSAAVLPEVSRIVVRGGRTVDLVRDGDGQWWIELESGDMPARADRIGEFLGVLERTRTSNRVASDPGLWSEFGLDRPTELLLLDTAGRDRAHVLFADRSNGQGFLRFASGDEVYGADSAPLFYLERDPVYWSKLRLLPAGITDDRVVSIAIRADLSNLNELPRRFQYTIQRTATGDWDMDGPGGIIEVRQSRARDLVATLVTLEGARFSREAAGPSGESATISVKLSDRREIVLELHAVGDRFVIRPVGPGVPLDRSGGWIDYEIPAWTLERLLRLPGDMVE